LIETHKIPICILNGAQGGTRIDQHQRNEADPTDVTTIYGRLLWRLQQAKLTHGVRAVLWHQGENDQGESGATGTFGWVNYEDYFIRMAARWKEDYPNIKHYYIHQIWPGACGSRSVENDRLRERQRRLPGQFSNMSIMSTLGIRPGGGCHYLPEGYAVMARQLFPLVNKYNYGEESQEPVTPPDIQSVSYTSDKRDEIKLTFDQDVKWSDEVARQFYLNDDSAELNAIGGAGRIITLKLSRSSTAKNLSYIRGGKWRQEEAIIWGSNGIAALTFCEVPILPPRD
ncbi:MAG: sialate O-acetylesterase, partial [Verrucomicrobiota bacterium]|nr:sialate O-acetylesterase [Verrucomicrobiota bacterium]